MQQTEMAVYKDFHWKWSPEHVSKGGVNGALQLNIANLRKNIKRNDFLFPAGKKPEHAFRNQAAKHQDQQVIWSTENQIQTVQMPNSLNLCFMGS